MTSIPKVYIITASVGTIELLKCIESVQLQDYDNIEHLIVCDGLEHRDNVIEKIEKIEKTKHNISTIVLPWNSGRDKYICHKIYASIPHLLHQPCYISFLDEDNFIDYNHISSMMKKIIDNKLDWTYCLRKIVDKNGNLICKDLCESLGKLSQTWVALERNKLYNNGKIDIISDYLVDTSSYLIPVEISRKFSECWQRRAREHPEADRLFYNYLSGNYKNYDCSMKYTLNYRLEGRPDSVSKDFFIMGNSKMKKNYNNDIPWNK